MNREEFIDRIITSYGNTGTKFCAYFNKNFIFPWCMAYVSYIMREIVEISDFPKLTSCTEFTNSNFARKLKNKSFETAEIGDIILYNWDNDNTQDHVGIVISNKEGIIKVVEGNYGDYPCDKTAVATRTFNISEYRNKGFLSWIIDMSGYFTDKKTEPKPENENTKNIILELKKIQKSLEEILKVIENV